MVELGRSDDALSWARRGIESTSGWQVAKLYDIAAEVIADRGDPGAVVDLRRKQHQQMPSSTTYALLKTVAASTDAWPVEQAAAREVLAARDVGGLVDALLRDGDTDAVWDAAAGSTADLGDQRWAQLATAAGLVEEFDEHLAALREQHRRRPSFMEILDKAGLR